MSFKVNWHSNELFRYYRFVIVVLAGVISLAIYLNGINPPPKAAPAAFYEPGADIVVKVSGDVKYPGIYAVSAKSMAQDVIKMAVVSVDGINSDNSKCYNDYLENGSEVRVSAVAIDKFYVSCLMMPVTERVVLQIPLDINDMGLDDFVLVPGIGRELANNIFIYRQSVGGSMSAKELANVSGIGKSKYIHIVKYFN